MCLLTCSSVDFHPRQLVCGQLLCVVGNIEHVRANDVCYFYDDLRVGRRMPFSVICTTATFLSCGTALVYRLRLISTIFVIIQQ